MLKTDHFPHETIIHYWPFARDFACIYAKLHIQSGHTPLYYYYSGPANGEPLQMNKRKQLRRSSNRRPKEQHESMEKQYYHHHYQPSPITPNRLAVKGTRSETPARNEITGHEHIVFAFRLTAKF